MPIALLSKESDWPFLKKKVNIALNKALIISLLLLLVQSKMQAQLCAGPLTVKMVGASSSMPITIDQETSSVYCTESNEGAINITVYGGTPTYDYQWAHDSLNQNFLIDLPVGSYYVTVTDGNGCSEERTISIVNVDPLADSVTSVCAENGASKPTRSKGLIFVYSLLIRNSEKWLMKSDMPMRSN